MNDCVMNVLKVFQIMSPKFVSHPSESLFGEQQSNVFDSNPGDDLEGKDIRSRAAHQPCQQQREMGYSVILFGTSGVSNGSTQLT